MKLSSKQTRRHTQKVATLRHIPSRAVCMWWLMALSMDSKKMVMLRKRQSVCYNLTCNSSGGLSGEAWGTERCLDVCVVVCWTVWLHVCVCVCMWANVMSWEGETANRTSGLVTALINLPLGHKSPALHSLFSPQPPSLRNREGAVAASFLSKSPSQPMWKHRTQSYVCVCVYIYPQLPH